VDTLAMQYFSGMSVQNSDMNRWRFA